MTTELQLLLSQMEWADAQVWNVVAGTPAVAEDTRVRELLHHLHGVQWAYLEIWRQEEVTLPALTEFADTNALLRWAQQYHDERRIFTAKVAPADLERHIAFPWAAEIAKNFGALNPTTLREAMLQIASHSTYHRGQLNTRIRELGAEPPLTDFVVWIWAGKPAADWSPLHDVTS